MLLCVKFFAAGQGDAAMKKKKNIAVTWIVMFVLVAAIVGVFFFLSKRKNSENYESESAQTEAAKLLEKDLELSYPATPREVIKFYCRIVKCLYSQEVKEEQSGQLEDKLRLLYDKEFLEETPFDEYKMLLQAEITEFKEGQRSITSYQVASAKNVDTWTDDEQEYARLVASFTYKEKTQFFKVYEEFALRRDDSGKWKILGWRLAEEEDMQ